MTGDAIQKHQFVTRFESALKQVMLYCGNTKDLKEAMAAFQEDLSAYEKDGKCPKNKENADVLAVIFQDIADEALSEYKRLTAASIKRYSGLGDDTIYSHHGGALDYFPEWGTVPPSFATLLCMYLQAYDALIPSNNLAHAHAEPTGRAAHWWRQCGSITM